MALKVKAKEKKLKFSKDSDSEFYRYVLVPELYSTLDQEKVIKEAAIRSGVSEGVMQACWKGAGAVIKAWATEGHSVALPGLGTMRFGLSAKAVADVNDVKTSLITTRRIVFTPTTELKEELANTAIQITCYDRNGVIVKRVTSADPGTVEDPENSNNENGEEGSQNQNSGSEQGGSEATTVEAPVIDGTTPFDESTEVTISGPEDAEIRYTTDGTAPNAQSTLYDTAITLTDTTTVRLSPSRTVYRARLQLRSSPRTAAMSEAVDSRRATKKKGAASIMSHLFIII